MKKFLAVIAVIVTLNSMNKTFAQNFNLSSTPLDEKMSVGLKINIPFFKESGDLSSLSGVYKFYGYFPLKNNWQINTEVPLVVSAWKDNEYNDNETGLANLFVEVQKALKADNTSYLALGMYIPTIGSENYDRMFIGVASDAYRFVQYQEGFTINSTIGYNLRNKPGAVFGVEIGPDILIPTGDGEVELLIHYGAKGGYRFNTLTTWAEFSGIWLTTEEGDLDSNSLNQIIVGGQLNTGKFRPGIFYGIFINEYMREGSNGNLGLNFQLVF
jgi:hypothetical protein